MIGFYDSDSLSASVDTVLNFEIVPQSEETIEKKVTQVESETAQGGDPF